jgi:hypothetical protein
MYAVVGCNGCEALWLLSDPEESETATCPRCGKRHRTRRLRRLHESPDREAARQARAAILAGRSGAGEAFASVSSADLDAAGEDPAVSDEEYLAGSGIDPETVAAADDDGGGSMDRGDVVRAAVREQDRPTEAEVVAYAGEHGVPAEAARDLLSKLSRAGEVTERDGRFRLL